ncbi:MAG: hypothetical protein LBL34_07030 [Clostridiales bacterium]|jgi:hypothetical protein|nr:hypothetical protein [Clostridiales bacterium]
MNDFNEAIEKISEALKNNSKNTPTSSTDFTSTKESGEKDFAVDNGWSIANNLGSGFAVNDKTQLLHALRPHLSARRLGKFDSALKIMQISRMANPRTLSGILGLLGGGD